MIRRSNVCAHWLTRWFESESLAFTAVKAWSRSDESVEAARNLLFEVDKVLDAGTFETRFSSAIARRFEESSKQARVDLFIRLALAGTLFYNLFLFVDTLIVPDAVGLAIVLQLGIATPMAVAMIVAILKFNFHIQYGAMLTLVTMTGCTIAILMTSRSDYIILFPAVFTLFLFSANVAQALHFKWAVIYTALTISSVFVALFLHPSFDIATDLFFGVVLLTAAQHSLSGNYRINAGMRRAYLFALRESLRAQLLFESNSQLSTMVDLDALTEVGNRDFFDRSLARIWQDKENHAPITIMMIDIDNFKTFNDTYGHQSGDACLKQVAHALADEVREIGPCCRYGGEEFAIALTGIDSDTAFRLAERLRRKIEALALSAEAPLPITISVGCATYRRQEHLRASDLIAAADAALYGAKAAGRNRTHAAPDPLRPTAPIPDDDRLPVRQIA